MYHALKPFQCPNCSANYSGRDIGRQFTQKFPVILPCNHSVCDNCLLSAVKGKTNFSCSLCKISVDLPSGNESVSKLHPDIYALGIINATKRSPLPSLKVKMVSSPEMIKNINLKNSLNSTVKICENCSQIEALWQCDECQSNFCNLCFDQVHKKIKSRKKHEVKKIFAELYNTLVQSGCPDHKNKSVEFYCERDDQLTCSHCMIIGSHMGHEVKTLADKNKSCADDLKNLLEDVCKVEKRLKYTGFLLEEVSSTEKLDISEYIKTIHDHFHKLHTTLQVREAELISELEDIANQQNKPFEKMLYEISGYQKDITSIKRDAESVIENPCLAISAPFLLKKLEHFKTIPCFLVPIQENNDNKKNITIDLHLSDDLETDLKKHGSFESSIKPRFHLVTTEELPENYCMNIPDSFATSDIDSQSNATADSFSDDSLVSSVSPKPGIEAAFKYREFNRAQTEEVLVSYIKDPFCFWVQKCSDVRKLKSVSDSLSKWCRSPEANLDKYVPIERGDMYLVQFSVDKKWYRGRVKKILEPGETYGTPSVGKKCCESKEKNFKNEVKVEVYYMDYGNSEVVPISKLRNIQPRFLHLPALAKQCSLVDIAPVEKKWSVEAIKSFSKFVNHKQVMMQIYEERNNILSVDLSQIPDSNFTNDVPVSVRDALVFLELAVFPSGAAFPSKRCRSKQQFLPPERIRANVDIPVIVSHVSSPSHFYVQQISTASYLSSLIFEMTDAYNHDKNSLLYSIYAPHVGMVCAAQFSVDKQWYRAQIKSLPGGANVEVQYVDFGNSETIHYRYIRKLSDKFSKLNIQAIPCKLADVTYNQDLCWSNEVNEWLTMKVSKKQLTLKSSGFDPAENKADVVLYYVEDEYEVCINALMVESGLASSCGLGSKTVRKKIDNPHPVFKNELEQELSYESLESVSPPISAPVENTPLPVLVKKFPETEGHHIEVHVSHIVNPSIFFIRIAGDIEKKLQKLMAEMQKTYTSFENEVETCSIGKSYAVFCDKRNQWYRGTIFSVIDEKTVKVQFVDYGIEEEIPIKNVRKLLDIFTADEEFSVRCELTGIIPAGGTQQWSHVACDAFHDLVTPHEILHLNFKGEIQKEIKSLPVSMYIEEIKLGGALEPTEVIYKNIASELVNRGLALPIRNSKPVCKSPEGCETEESTLVNERKENPQSPVKSAVEYPEVSNEIKEQNILIEEPIPVLQPKFQWKPVVYPPDHKFKGFVTNIGEDGSIQLHAVQPGANQSLVEMIKKTLQFKYSKLTTQPPVKPPPPGEACIAKFTVDSLWYRAEIIAVYPDKVKVNFVDYGNNEIVPLADIRTQIILQDFPKQCMDCVIFGLHTGKPGDWDDGLLNFLHSQLVESIVDVESLGPPDKNGKLPCHIINNCGVDVGGLLESIGFMKTDSKFIQENKTFQQATELREGDIFPVCITQINSPNIVYLQRLKIQEPKSDFEKEYNKEHDDFLHLIKELQEKAETFPKVEEPMPGLAYCAKYSYDNNWYRCEVADIVEKGVVVLYVDYGNSETITTENLRYPDNHIIDFPVQVHFCEIYGMSHVGNDWDPDVKKFMIDRLLGSGQEIFAKVIVPGQISQIDLMVKDENGEMKLAYEELVNCNLITLQRQQC